jgi:hypothetical protein
MHKSVRPAVAIVILALFSSCNDLTAPTTVAEAKALWQSQNLSSYSYTASHACFCVIETVGPVKVEVAQGAVFRVTNLATGAEVSAHGWYTIDQLFDQLLVSQDQLRSVEFDARLGYPTRIERCCIEVDSGSIYTATDLAAAGEI